MIKLTITGDVSSKKNGKQIFWNKRTGKPFITSSNNHDNWYNQALPQLYKIKPLESKIERLTIVLYPKTKRRGDLDNKAASILDLLVDAKLLKMTVGISCLN